MKTLESIKQGLDELALNNQKQIEECTANIERSNERLKTLNDRLMEAEDNTDAKAYAKVKEDIKTAQYTRELFVTKKQKLESEPLIIRDDYKKLLADIKQTTDELIQEQDAKGAKIIRELRKVAEQEWSYVRESNQLLKSLQYEIYKDADKHVADTGNVFSISEKYVNNDLLSGYYELLIAGSWFEKNAGIDNETHKTYGA